jgi:hypothetical protein
MPTFFQYVIRREFKISPSLYSAYGKFFPSASAESQCTDAEGNVEKKICRRRNKTQSGLAFHCLLALVLCCSACTRTAFSPIWYSVSPPAVHDFKDKGDWHAAGQYIDADNGGGVLASVMHSPVKHLIVGLGAGTVGNKGTFFLQEEVAGISRHTQVDIMGGGYLRVWREFVALQCITGFTYGSTYSKTGANKVLNASYQKLFLQPTLLVRLPNNMSLDVSVRQSQLNFTSARVVVGGLPDHELTNAQLIQTNSPLKVREIHAGYTYGSQGPISIGVTYSINTILNARGLDGLSYEAISVPVRMNIQELMKETKVKKKTKKTIQEGN